MARPKMTTDTESIAARNLALRLQTAAPYARTPRLPARMCARTPRMPARMLACTLVLLISSACEGEDPTVTPGPPAPDLLMPDMTGLDMPAQLKRGFTLALGADLRSPWSAFVSAMALRDECPDLFAGSMDNDEMPALYWSDSCKTAGGVLFEGDQGWESLANRDVLSETSYVDTGERTLKGTSTIESQGVDSEMHRLFAFTGEGTDSFYASIDSDGNASSYSRWTYSASVNATVSGSLIYPDGSTISDGLREDLYLAYSGGSADQLTMRGDLFLLQETFDRFDSVSLDLTLYGPKGAPPNTCLKEPYGYIGLRDTSAYWYEVVFMPMDQSEAGADSPECDGCGTLFVRGVEQPDPVCVSFDDIWQTLQPPVLTDYVYSVRL